MKTIAYLLLAAVLLGAGVYRQYYSNAVSAADQARCEQNVRELYATSPETVALLAEKCNEPGVVAAMAANAAGDNAQATAQAISGANKGGILFAAINGALIGGGIGAIAAAFMAARRKTA